MTDTDRANAIYSILVAECGATERERDYFVDWFTRGRQGGEYRFCGLLGVGGKWYADNRVAYYVEDRTEAREAMKRQANDLLKALEVSRA